MAKGRKPAVVIISGPNGAGKSTIAPRVLRGALAVSEFVNADVIARGLSAVEPESVALEAGRLMLERLRRLAEATETFAFETTLASRSFAPWISTLRQQGYLFHLIYLWLPVPNMAIERVATRVLMGGHFVPDETVRRRHAGGLRNFFELYRPIADTWRCYDSSQARPAIVASGKGERHERIYLKEAWQAIIEAYRQARQSA